AAFIRGIEVDRRIYTMLKEKLEEARITEAQKAGDISILDPAVMPAPKKKPYQAGGFVGAMMGLILGVVFSFLAETLDTSIGTIEDVENVVKLPVLAVIPSIIIPSRARQHMIVRTFNRIFHRDKTTIEEDAYTRLIVHHLPKSPISESYRNLRTNMKLSKNNKAIMFTSAEPREGKTTVLINLALTLHPPLLLPVYSCPDHCTEGGKSNFGFIRFAETGYCKNFWNEAGPGFKRSLEWFS
ncbi:GNVR domain-containing protein, partial [Candidatus Margulisiibacteriota bacterium]